MEVNSRWSTMSLLNLTELHLDEQLGDGISPRPSVNIQIKHGLLVAGLRITCNERLRRKVQNRAYL